MRGPRDPYFWGWPLAMVGAMLMLLSVFFLSVGIVAAFHVFRHLIGV